MVAAGTGDGIATLGTLLAITNRVDVMAQSERGRFRWVILRQFPDSMERVLSQEGGHDYRKAEIHS